MKVGDKMDYIKINKLIKKPIYLQISESIEEAFFKGLLKHGDALPTDKQLCETFGISPKVVSMMYKHVLKKGFVVRHIGKGTFIDARKMTVVQLKKILQFDQLEGFKIETVYISKIKKPSSVKIQTDEVFVLYQLSYFENNVVVFKKIFLDESYEQKVLSMSYTNLMIKDDDKIDTIDSKFIAINILDIEAMYLKINKYDPGFLATTYYKNNSRVLIQEERYFSALHTTWEDTLEYVYL